MASIVIAGDTSGSVTISAPAIAGTPTLTLPTTSGTIAVTGGSPSFATLTVTGDASISGLTVGKGGGAAATNTAVGASALAANTSGDSNVAIGFSALVANTTGTYNVSVGRNSLLSNTTGSSNSALGHTALNSNTTGGSSTAIGFQALYSNTTASNNTAVGYQAMYSNTTGQSNCAFGTLALYSNTTGTDNTAVGNYETLYSNTTGSSNIAVGRQALRSNTVANNNTAVGYQALYSGTDVGANTAVGSQAGFTFNGDYGYNTLVGRQAGYSLSGSTGGYGNTFIGCSSATGQGAGYAVTTGNNNTILGGYSGNQGGLDIRTSSNFIVLSDGDGNPRAFVNNLGYFKAAPSASDILSTGGNYHELISNDDANNTLYVANKSTNTTTNGMVRLDAYRNTTNNTFYVLGYYNQGAGAYKLRIADSGNVTNTNGSYGTISDAKNKENIVDATPKLDKINQLQVRNFNFKGDDLKQIGFIAQEFEQIFPSMVEEHHDKDADGNDLGTTTKSIKTSVLVPILVKAIQELNAKVEAQAAEIAALKGAN